MRQGCRSTRGRWRRSAAVLVTGLLATAPLAAQACRGDPEAASGWLALEAGRAARGASVFGADAGWRASRPLTLFADGSVTTYPRPDPARDRLAIGGAFRLAHASRLAACLTSGIEAERISDLHILRVPLGLALGWATTFDTGRRRLGIGVTPAFVYSRQTIAGFFHSSNYLSVRAAVQFGARRWFVGLEHEQAFDGDARWHTLGRVGYAFR